MLKKTREALYYVTSGEVGWIRGTDRATFTITTIDNLGGAYGHPHACAAFRDIMFYLTADHQVAGVRYNNPPEIISKPLGTQLRDTILASANTEVSMDVYTRDGNYWLVVAVVDKVTHANSRLFVYDMERQMWFPPWKKSITAFVCGRVRDDDPKSYLIAMRDDVADGTGQQYVTLLDETYTEDDPGDRVIDGFATISCQTVPAGNHINEMRKPAHHPMLSYLLLERTKFSGDTEPTVAYRLDEINGAFTNVVAVDPPFIAQRTSYRHNWYPIQQVCQRVQMKITMANESKKFEVQNIGFVFQPEAGA
jgi:hypothetical protein